MITRAVVSKMSNVEWKKWGRNISLFLLSRYPIVNALTFLMLLSERATREKKPPMDPNVIYTHVGIMIGAGLAMGFNFRRKLAALSHVVQLFVLAYTIQSNAQLHYKSWLRNKMCLRMLGVSGYILLYAFFTCNKPRPQYLRRAGETIVGIYFAVTLYFLLQEPKEKEAFLKLALGGYISLFVVALLFATIALCYIPGLFVNDVTHVLLFLLWFMTLGIDCRMHYWTKLKGVEFWNQIRLIGDNAAMMLGCLMYITCTKKVTYEHTGHGAEDHQDNTTEDDQEQRTYGVSLVDDEEDKKDK